MDHRITDHARFIVTYSTEVKRGDHVLIVASDCGLDLASEVYNESAKLGASPIIVMTPSEATRKYFELTPEEYLDIFPRHLYELIEASDVIISIKSDLNTRSLSNIDPRKMTRRDRATSRLRDMRQSKRWCGTQTPTPGLAQEAGMSLKEYEDFVYSAILIDYSKQHALMERLKQLLDRADRIQLIGEMTNLSMSIKGRNTVVEYPKNNVPSGEVSSAPVDDSAEGEIWFDVPSLRYGREVKGVWLKFTKGELIDYSAETNMETLRYIVQTDEGSKRLGEIGIGTNSAINRITRNTLFDEKISGTVHLAFGNAYKASGGVNRSAIHWDLVKTMKPGQIVVDGNILQKDGRFMLK